MKSTTVLLVEDDPDNVELTLRAFRKNNLTNTVVVARDGVEALDYLFGTGAYATRDVSDVPRLILLDLNLPKINGLEVLRRIRADARTELLPVVILSTSTERGDIVKSYSLGANSYVCKPTDFDRFTSAIQQLGQYWLSLNEDPMK